MSSNGTSDPRKLISGIYFVRLIPKSDKGRRLCSKYGDVGWVLKQADEVQTSALPGPWLQIALGECSCRWVNASSDPDFIVMPANQNDQLAV